MEQFVFSDMDQTDTSFYPDFADAVDPRLVPSPSRSHQTKSTSAYGEVMEATEALYGRLKEQSFRSLFGISSLATAEFLEKYWDSAPESAKFTDFINLLHFMHEYPTSQRAAATMGRTGSRQIHEALLLATPLSQVMDEIRFEDAFDYPFPHWGPLGGNIGLVDTTLAPWHKFCPGTDLYRKMLSLKHGTPGLKYLSMTPFLGGCFNYFGLRGDYGANHDTPIYEESPLRVKMAAEMIYTLPDHTRWAQKIFALADKGFEGEDSATLSTPFKGAPATLAHWQLNYNEWLTSARAQVENSYARLKNNFQFLKVAFRGHDMDRFDDMVQLAAQLTQLDSRYRPIRRHVPQWLEEFLVLPVDVDMIRSTMRQVHDA